LPYLRLEELVEEGHVALYHGVLALEPEHFFHREKYIEKNPKTDPHQFTFKVPLLLSVYISQLVCNWIQRLAKLKLLLCFSSGSTLTAGLNA
jgi:hypothetical protein